jgi:hypothetical protein
MTVVVETDFDATGLVAATNVVGTLTSGGANDVANRTIWATSATNTKRLLRLDIKNNNAATVYYQAQATAVAETGTATAGTVRNSHNEILTTVTKSFFFGRDGISPFRTTAAGVESKGCYIRLALTPAFTAIIASIDFNIRAIYAP